tara:strand:+ start:174 stop:593 length:420 start_codon:yes stop_codon:yes gene_type:complete
MQKTLLFTVVITIMALVLSTKSYSVEPNEFLQNPKKELRARDISKNVRCLVCQNQSIDDSSALLAKDLRILIREKIESGYTDNEIYKYLADRYGDFILLKPPFRTNTFILWVFPFVLFIIGIFVIFFQNKKSNKKHYNI